MADDETDRAEIELRQWCVQVAGPIAREECRNVVDVAEDILAWVKSGKKPSPAPLKAVA